MPLTQNCRVPYTPLQWTRIFLQGIMRWLRIIFYCKSADDYLLYPFLNPASSLVLNISLIGYSRSNGVLTWTQKVIGWLYLSEPQFIL